MSKLSICLAATVATLTPAAADAQVGTAPALSPTSYGWAVGKGPVALPWVQTHVCLLTAVSGKFEGYGEWVQLAVDSGAPGGARYILRGSSNQNELRAGATCAEKSQFIPAKPGAPITELVGDWTKNGSCNTFRKDVASDKNHAVFLAGMGGKFHGGGEKIETRRAANGTSQLLVDACSGSVQASTASFGGFLIGPPVYYRTQTARIADSTKASFVAHQAGPDPSPGWPDWLPGGPGADLSAGPPTNSVQMIPVAEGMCGITMIRGKLQGYGEKVQIFQQKASDGRLWWFLTVTEQGDETDIWAAARCIARDQRG